MKAVAYSNDNGKVDWIVFDSVARAKEWAGFMTRTGCGNYKVAKAGSYEYETYVAE